MWYNIMQYWMVNTENLVIFCNIEQVKYPTLSRAPVKATCVPTRGMCGIFQEG